MDDELVRDSSVNADIVLSAGLIYAIAPVLVAGVLSLLAYLFRQNSKAAEANKQAAVVQAATVQELKDIARRTARLEDAVFMPRGDRA
jgi:hypothetical protein